MGRNDTVNHFQYYFPPYIHLARTTVVTDLGAVSVFTAIGTLISFLSLFLRRSPP